MSMGKVAKAKHLTIKARDILKAQGIKPLARAGAKYAYYKVFPDRKKKFARDILFINGCALPHPARYRVDHQIEQLRSSNMTADTVFYDQVNPDLIKYYRGFVFFRCPITDEIREFIRVAKSFNKKCFFDIDDLVIDTKYTDEIGYVKGMSVSDRNLYNDGVNRMQETLRMCDATITTTEDLASELANYAPEVFVNRNVASDEMVACSVRALETVEKDEEKVVIGYFSGSITHNADFELVLPSLIKLLKKHDNLYIKIAGILDTPPALADFSDRIIATGFADWREMPMEMAKCDINLAPLEDTIFNRAKSENKWVEAALVNIPTVASNVGAFKHSIVNDSTGVLVDGDWLGPLDELIRNKKKRCEIGRAAHDAVIKSHVTVYSGYRLSEFITSQLAKNIVFVLPSSDISGGVNVALKHIEILRRHGYDVSIIDEVSPKLYREARRLPDDEFNVLIKFKTKIEMSIDNLVGTLWTTVKFVQDYPQAIRRSYFVQSFETDFMKNGDPNRLVANSTYNANLDYLTMSRWCQGWLKDRYGKTAKHASNGINLDTYPSHIRKFSGDEKIRILIEGDSRDAYKNTDEAFRVTNKLDRDLYEVSYLSYRREPKKWYEVDHFYNRIAPDKVGEVYAKNDILIKTSLLESFSYPPLEMMATGGFVMAIPNGGNQEYLRDGENCLLFEHGDTAVALRLIDSIRSDKKLRERLNKNGLETAKSYEWNKKEDDILKLYA